VLRLLLGRSQGDRAIPRIIHQTWKTADVPPRFAAWRESWARLHPGWQHRLWTDEDNRCSRAWWGLGFIAEENRFYLTLTIGYLDPI
jgi:hypothetical protein